MATQFEQTAELNRHVDATIPLTWSVRWKAIRPVLPMLACCSVLLVEQVAFRLWLNAAFFSVALYLFCGCKPSDHPAQLSQPYPKIPVMKDYDAAIQSGVSGQSYPGQFNRLFPGAKNTIIQV